MIQRLVPLLFLFVIFFFGNGSAQIAEPIFKHFTGDDGFPSSQVYEAMQDNDGYMWFATDRGVVKYNGYEFKTFTAKDGLTDNVVFRLFQDHRNRIWMITFSGCIFIYEKNKITAYKYNFKIKNLLKGSFQLNIYVDSLENVFVGSTSGLFKVDNTGLVSQRFNFSVDGKQNKLIIDQQSNEEHPIAIGSAIFKFCDTYIFSITKSRIDSLRILSSSTGRISVIRLKSKLLLVSIGSELYEYKNNALTQIATISSEILNLLETPDHELWVSTAKGIYVFYQPGNYSAYYHYLKDKYIAGIARDKEGGYWISTIDDGVYYLLNSAVKNYITDHKLKSPLALTQDRSAIYAGYFSGSLAKINTEHIKFIINDSSDKHIDCIYFDTSTARLYIGNDKLCYIENDTVHSLKSSTGKRCNIGFAKNKEGVFSGAFSAIIKITDDSSHREVDFKTRINCIALDEKDEFLLGCIDGAYIYDSRNKSISLISPLLKDVRIDDIESLNGNLCFATQGKGLMILLKDGTIKIIDESQGLCSNIIRKLSVCGNKIWCASSNGVSEIVFTDLKKLEFRITHIGTNEGLLSNEINDITTLGDTVWVASKKGISFFNANTDFINHAHPQIYFTAFQVNSIDTPPNSNYLFSHTSNNISIGFESPLFKSDGKQIYQYLLTDAMDSIKGITNTRSVQFLSLKPGAYSLHIKAMNNSNIWSDRTANLNFTILAPWWQTWRFMLLVSIVVAASVFSFYRIRMKKLKEKFNVERKQASLQLTAMRAQMNPHFIFNVMSSIRNYMQHNDMKSAEKYLTSFAKLVRYTLDNSSINEVTLEEELQALRSYTMLEMQRLEFGFDFDVHCENDIDLAEIMVPSLLLQPFVENAIKHGIERLPKKGRISIDIKKQNNNVLIAVEDNGVGRENASKWNDINRKEHTSLGSRLTFERIDFFNKAFNKQIKMQVIDLNTTKNPRTGTRVEIVL